MTAFLAGSFFANQGNAPPVEERTKVGDRVFLSFYSTGGGESSACGIDPLRILGRAEISEPLPVQHQVS